MTKSLLIKDTTKEEREAIVNKAIDIASLSCNGPLPDEDLKLYQKYIDGIIELTEIKKIILSKFNHE